MRVAVLGGGLAGLAAARRLAGSGAEVALLEAGPRPGGQIRTERTAGYLIEHGAEGLPARRPLLAELCAELGCADQVLPQADLPTLVLRDSALAPLAPGEAARMLGMQVNDLDLGAGIVTLRDGLGALVEALVRALGPGAELRTGAAVRRLAPAGGGWVVSTAGASDLRVDAVVCALPPRAAARLLGPLGAEVGALERLPLSTSVTVSLAFRRTAVRHPLEATGFVVPGAGTWQASACTFVSSKFPGRAPEGHCLLRVFFRPRAGEAWTPDAVWTERAACQIGPVLGLDEPPLGAWVARWPDALPRPPATHADDVARLRASLGGLPPIEVAGSAVDGGGADGALRSGLAAAGRLLARGSG